VNFGRYSAVKHDIAVFGSPVFMTNTIVFGYDGFGKKLANGGCIPRVQALIAR